MATIGDIIIKAENYQECILKLNDWFELPLLASTNLYKTQVLECQLLYSSSNLVDIIDSISILLDYALKVLHQQDESNAHVEQQEQEDQDLAVSFVNFSVGLVEAYMELQQKGEQLKKCDVMDILRVMHDQLLSIDQETFGRVQETISRCCETCFTAQLDECETVVAQTVSYLLMKTVSPLAKQADIKRIYAIREALSLFDFEDENTESLRDLLLYTFISPQFIRVSEGKKFLAYILSLGHSMALSAFEVVKGQLAVSSKNSFAAYGEVFYKAWKHIDGKQKSQFENDCLQELMNASLHMEWGSFGKMRLFFAIFYNHKRVTAVDDMLYRLYSPILWRALNVANGKVRKNAVCTLVDVFPLRDPESTPEDFDALLQRQFDILRMLLKDSNVQVRASAIQGLCRIFAVYWEMIPTEVLSDCLTVMSTELAFDSASAETRLSVITGFSFLLRNCPLCHASMKRYLKALGRLLHDGNLKNRLALLDLLHIVKSSLDIKFWDVVELPHLLYRLQHDTQPSVDKRIIGLLINSFFPLKKDNSVLISRAAILLDKNAAAARKFYIELCNFVPVENLVSFSKSIYESIYYSQCQDEKSKKKFKNQDNVEVLNTIACNIVGFFEILALLLDSIVPIISLDANSALKEDLISLFDRLPIANLLSVADEHPDCLYAIFGIAKHALSGNISDLGETCQSMLIEYDEISPLHDVVIDCFCNWGIGDTIVEAALDWVENLIFGRQKTGKRPQRIKITKQHFLSLYILEKILSDDVKRGIILLQPEKLELLNNYLRQGLQNLTEGLTDTSIGGGNTESRFYFYLFDIYCLLNLHGCKSLDDQKQFLIGLQQIYSSMPLTMFSSTIDSEDEDEENDDRGKKRSLEDGNNLFTMLLKSLQAFITFVQLHEVQSESFAIPLDILNTLLKNEVSIEFLDKTIPQYLSESVYTANVFAIEGYAGDAEAILEYIILLLEHLLPFIGERLESMQDEDSDRTQLNRFIIHVEKSLSNIHQQKEAELSYFCKNVINQLLVLENEEFSCQFIFMFASMSEIMFKQCAKIVHQKSVLLTDDEMSKLRKKLIKALKKLGKLNNWDCEVLGVQQEADE
ncbi:hypothetical protein MP228_003350 [Amoeboaphelidium protococcarum]|nr:hypothetical protein MP228_003350 [Amoeboaphelidium protococcarum]